MDITKGSLDGISRPASSERSRPGNRASSLSLQERGRVGHAIPGSLVVLSPDVSVTEIQVELIGSWFYLLNFFNSHPNKTLQYSLELMG